LEEVMSNTKDNGRVQRRSLGDEIERLHDLLDGLNDASEASSRTPSRKLSAALFAKLLRLPLAKC
jgi:hypothetical protein